MLIPVRSDALAAGAADGAADGHRDAVTLPRREVVVAPSGRWTSLNASELWRNRSLLLFLSWRDIKVRYAQTALGASWAILQPLLSVFVFTVIFGVFAKVPSDGVPYAAFALTAMVPWTYFSTAFSGASNSLVQNTNLITKVYFPRLVIPLSSVVAGLLDFVITLAMLGVVLVVYGLRPSPSALWVLPVLVVALMLTAAGVGCWLAALNIKYRDVKYVTPFLLQILQYATPIVYPMSIVPPRWRWLFALNPLTGIVEGFRAVLLRTSPVPWTLVGLSLASGLVLFAAGALYFRRTERVFADVA